MLTLLHNERRTSCSPSRCAQQSPMEYSCFRQCYAVYIAAFQPHLRSTMIQLKNRYSSAYRTRPNSSGAERLRCTGMGKLSDEL